MSLRDGSEGEGVREESVVFVVPKDSEPGGCRGVK
jgi:hypothetical protein